jgi:hypothetical protein
MTVRLQIMLLGVGAMLGLAACRTLDRFDTGEDEAYCGAMVSAPFAHESFLPVNAPPTLQMRLRLDTDRLTTLPGSISTDDADRGLCAPLPLFDQAPLRAIEEAFHDPISTLNFGQGREHNLLVWVDSECQGTLVGVVSLMKSDDVELRLLKPAPHAAPDADPAERPGFAQFLLRRRKGDCNF